MLRRFSVTLVLLVPLVVGSFAGPATAAAASKRVSVTPMSALSSGCASAGYTILVTIKQRGNNAFIGSARFHESASYCYNGSSWTSGPTWVDRSSSGVQGVFTGISRTDHSHDLFFNFYDRSM